ncbi:MULTISPECIES: helix-hairpin-helix domain-containing protein [Caldimonas]|uniref:ComEA family DNA-binding protein n=1 Tax=Caldimonas TaxID=196013 RepID=UPI00146AF453|nr:MULTISPECIES: helix-hairpin-helix domain-containing protein [Caldimonas]MCX7660609.1 helix-hairpin-helix domain-containing protein [Caldimonas manganoxidans]
MTLLSPGAHAVGDVNRLDATGLQSVKGIGPKLAERIVTERRRSPFRDWDDFIDRMPGVGERKARQWSAQGLTVNGVSLAQHQALGRRLDPPARAAAR